MHGVKLTSLSSPDLLDVIHYMFEEDLQVSTAEEAEAKDSYRVSLYRSLYDTEYMYARSKSSSSNTDYGLLDPPLDEELEDFSSEDIYAKNSVPKPFIPATNFNPGLENPFAGSKLDAPLN